MSADRTEDVRASENGYKPEDEEGEKPLPREALDDPKARAQIEEARESIRQGRTRPGKTQDDLVDMARDQRREVDTRS